MSPIEGEVLDLDLDLSLTLSVGQLERLGELHQVHRYELRATDETDGVITIGGDPQAAVSELLLLAHLGRRLLAAVAEDRAVLGRSVTSAAHRAWWPIVRSMP